MTAVVRTNDEPLALSNVFIDQTSGAYFGDRNVFCGPTTIEKIVIPVGNPPDSDKCDGGDKTDGAIKDAATSLNKTHQTEKKSLNDLKNKSACCHTRSKKKLTVMIVVGALFLGLVVIVTLILTKVFDSNHELKLVLRPEWGALPPWNETTPLKTPVPYVIIHHTASDACMDHDECIKRVQLIQWFHMKSRGFFDIGYNFLVSGNGDVFEARGWTVEGAHSYGYNFKSIGIAFIGTFNKEKPPGIQMSACKALIAKGVELGYIQPDYKLLAVRQLQATESPGAEFFTELKTWPHWSEEP